MSRADGKGEIFVRGADGQDLLRALAEGSPKTGFQVRACCRKRNHFHLVVETPNANLVEGMRWCMSAYTLRFNHWRDQAMSPDSYHLSCFDKRRGSCLGAMVPAGVVPAYTICSPWSVP